MFAYLGFPIFMKPANGGGWKDVYKCDTPEDFFAAYDKTRDLEMMAQEAIEFTDYYRCYVVGPLAGEGSCRTTPREPHHLRYAAARDRPVPAGDGRARDPRRRSRSAARSATTSTRSSSPCATGSRTRSTS